jgi:hypothetical protein
MVFGLVSWMSFAVAHPSCRNVYNSLLCSVGEVGFESVEWRTETSDVDAVPHSLLFYCSDDWLYRNCTH